MHSECMSECTGGWALSGAASLDGSQVFAPGSAAKPRRCWTKIQYNWAGAASGENNIANLQIWAQALIPSATQFSQTRTTAPLRFNQLANTLNSGQLLNAAVDA